MWQINYICVITLFLWPTTTLNAMSGSLPCYIIQEEHPLMILIWIGKTNPN